MRRHWRPGLEFDVVETAEGVLLRPRSPFPATRIEEVGGHLNYSGPRVPDERLSIAGIPYRDAYEEDDDGA